MSRSSHNSSRIISDIWPMWTEDGGAESSGSVSQSAVGGSHQSEAILDWSSVGTRERGHIPGDAVKKTLEQIQRPTPQKCF